jgi:preprotein translocase subunit SecA
MIRKDHPDLVFKTEEAKFNAVVEDIAERYERGQPVLVGTVSVEKSERLSRQLQKRGIPHNVLNAKQHAREAVVVAQAGRLHAITVATNMAGRGVDIILGGNPDGLAEQEAFAEGLPQGTPEWEARVAALMPGLEAQCDAEGDKVRELGGLYVLATERHESRRIDNQLRGRSGRQGDPGESRFYLSLEDELMRLFATGAMSWVMGKALPEDVPIEARMVTKAIERAQNTVEARNAEIRKNVLEYDEVMNEQRKVIYKRREQILQGVDLRQEALDNLRQAVEHAVGVFCSTPYQEDWDVEGLVNEIAAYYPTKFTADELLEAATPEMIVESLYTEGLEYYEAREADLGEENLREIERRVMLSIIDQQWREHLYEMDYLQEGINLRAMGQQDPLVAWKMEGYEMFSQMMAGIADDFVKYVMHLEVVVEQPEAPQITNVELSAPEDPVAGRDSMREAAIQHARDMGEAADPELLAAADEPVAQAPVVKTAEEKVGRNDPCWCGSGKKFKHCHGA